MHAFAPRKQGYLLFAVIHAPERSLVTSATLQGAASSVGSIQPAPMASRKSPHPVAYALVRCTLHTARSYLLSTRGAYRGCRGSLDGATTIIGKPTCAGSLPLRCVIWSTAVHLQDVAQSVHAQIECFRLARNNPRVHTLMLELCGLPLSKERT